MIVAATKKLYKIGERFPIRYWDDGPIEEQPSIVIRAATKEEYLQEVPIRIHDHIDWDAIKAFYEVSTD